VVEKQLVLSALKGSRSEYFRVNPLWRWICFNSSYYFAFCILWLIADSAKFLTRGFHAYFANIPKMFSCVAPRFVSEINCTLTPIISV
jgi:hypothetical protein